MTDQANSNPLLERISLPGETFRLPSRGLFYKDGELDDNVVDGEVHILPMTTYDEIILKTPDMLFNGTAIDRVFQRCIPQIKKPQLLLSKDVDYLIICLRKVTYGDKMEITHTHNCKNAKEHNYLVDVSKIIREAREIDPTTMGKTYETKLPNGQVVRLQPMRFQSVIKLLQDLNVNKPEDAVVSPEQETEDAIFNIMSVIVDVDGITDKEQIDQWVREIPSAWGKQISNTIRDIEGFGTSNRTRFKCRDCNKMMEIDIPINPISFFM